LPFWLVSKRISGVDLIGLGESSLDYVNLLPQALGPDAPSKLRIDSKFDSCGGQVATMLAAASALGRRASYLGPIGNDDNGRRIRDELTRRGVDVSTVIVHDAASRFAIILVDESTGERTVLWHRDERLALTEAEIVPAMLNARALHVDGVDEPAAIRAAQLASERGLLVTCDLDRVTDRTPELVAHVTMPVLAEHVPESLTGERDPERALRKLRKHHPGVLCVTLGVHGSMALEGDRVIHAPAFPVHAIDTTGAGDVFRAGFVHGALSGWPTADILRFANAAAAVSCTRLGAMSAIPTLAEVEELLRESVEMKP
jgi:sugar/nucleoside kinase (ribokinase family)